MLKVAPLFGGGGGLQYFGTLTVFSCRFLPILPASVRHFYRFLRFTTKQFPQTTLFAQKERARKKDFFFSVHSEDFSRFFFASFAWHLKNLQSALWRRPKRFNAPAAAAVGNEVQIAVQSVRQPPICLSFYLFRSISFSHSFWFCNLCLFVTRIFVNFFMQQLQRGSHLQLLPRLPLSFALSFALWTSISFILYISLFYTEFDKLFVATPCHLFRHWSAASCTFNCFKFLFATVSPSGLQKDP